ncbi:hypothetical protein [Nonomuraea helvata]|uniref:hypothetical protein n=1 Tax=Nonomuraea helvata TaxID=37484 RepID=UPI0031E92286
MSITTGHRPPSSPLPATTWRPPHSLTGGVPQIVVCVDGEAHLGDLTLRPGESAFIPAAVPSVRLSGKGTAYCASPGAFTM